MAFDWRERITVDPAVLVGKPVVRGTRLPVEFVLDLVAAGWSFDDLVANYPGLTVEGIRACVAYAKDVLAEVQVFPMADLPVGRLDFRMSGTALPGVPAGCERSVRQPRQGRSIRGHGRRRARQASRLAPAGRGGNFCRLRDPSGGSRSRAWGSAVKVKVAPYVLFYRIDDATGTIWIVVAWSAMRGSGFALREPH